MEEDNKASSSVSGLSRRAVVGGVTLAALTTTGAMATTARAATGKAPGIWS
ncbi:hypothetical protein [Streptomyces dioscori]|uniref:hypothetical protein n=1 Tax=Streptomyces dioscori TaxID=2109333 RepID=UPI00131D353C|nr:hypothetical protein [Streptomyces dioscori]